METAQIEFFELHSVAAHSLLAPLALGKSPVLGLSFGALGTTTQTEKAPSAQPSRPGCGTLICKPFASNAWENSGKNSVEIIFLKTCVHTAKCPKEYLHWTLIPNSASTCCPTHMSLSAGAQLSTQKVKQPGLTEVFCP